MEQQLIQLLIAYKALLIKALLVFPILLGLSVSPIVPQFGEVEEPSFGAVGCVTETATANVRTLIAGKADKAILKGKELAKLNCIPKTRITYYFDGSIEIVSLKEIDKGVEAFVRAWDVSGEQIGFGKDGTVDMERFVIINPPILVSDPLGTIIRQYEIIPDSGQFITDTFREDLQESLLRRIALAISVKTQIHDSSKIVLGKVGNTTLTASPQESTGTAPIDGRMSTTELNGLTFDNIRNNEAGDAHSDTATNIYGNLRGDGTTDRFDVLRRGGHGYNTSSIGSDPIISGNIQLFPYSKATALGTADIDITSFSPADDSDYVNSDFAVTNFGGTELVTGQDIGGMTLDTYTTFTLNASGETHINKLGNTNFSIRISWDTDNSFGGTWASGGQQFILFRSVDEAGTDKDPVLTVEHGAAAAAPETPFWSFAKALFIKYAYAK